jgi:hypothetical protein
MLKWLIRRRIAAYEREYDYDSSYVLDMLDASSRAVFAFSRIAAIANYRHGVTPEAWYAAKIATVMAEDCGPCTQLVVTMAERAGVAPGVLRALVNRDERGMPEAAALGFRFAERTLAHDPNADELRDEIRRRWGQQGLVSLAFAIATARVFPTVKYALGHGKACQRITVGGAVTPILRRAA